MRQTYNIVLPRTAFSAAGALLQFVVPADKSVEVIDLQVNQETATASAQHALELATMADPASGGSAAVPARVRALGSAATVAAHGPFAAQGTADETKAILGWNIVNGSTSKTPVPDARFLFPGGAVVALRLLTAPAAPTVFSGQITIIES